MSCMRPIQTMHVVVVLRCGLIVLNTGGISLLSLPLKLPTKSNPLWIALQRTNIVVN